MAFLFRRKLKNPLTKITKIIYYIQWTEQSTGKLKKISTKCGLKSEAEKVFTMWKNKSIVGCNTNIFLSELIQEVLKYIKLNLPDSYSIYRSALNNFLRVSGDKLVKLITVSDIENFKVDRISNVSTVTVHKEIRTIKSAFNKAQNQIGLIHDHKLSKASNIKIIKTNLRKRFTIEEMNLITKNLKHIPTKRTTLIAMNTGMRLNEIINLQHKDVDLSKRIIHIRNKVEIGFKTKTSEERDIPINDALYDYLLDWIGTDKIIDINSPELFVIGFRYKQKNTISRKVSNGIKKLGIVGTLHCLRHSFASELIDKGVDIETVRELLGHSKISTTAIYTHSTNEAKVIAVNKFKICM